MIITDRVAAFLSRTQRPQTSEPPVATFAHALIHPTTGEALAYHDKAGHLVGPPFSLARQPTVALSSAWVGSGASASLYRGTDRAGIITIGPITGSGANDTNELFTVTFAAPYATEPCVIAAYASRDTALDFLEPLIAQPTRSGFSVSALNNTNIMESGTLYWFSYMVVSLD